MTDTDRWKKFCKAKEGFMRELDALTANCMLEEADSDVRLYTEETKEAGVRLAFGALRALDNGKNNGT